MRRLALLFLFVAAPTLGRDIAAVNLAAGEAVTIEFDDGGRTGEPRRSNAIWSTFDLYAARQLAGITPPDEPVPQGMPIHGPEEMRPEPIPGDQVRLRMLSIAGQHTLLVVENGRDRALAYRARMVVNGRESRTDVCVVLPNLPSYEHWAFPIERLHLYDFRFIPWPPGRNPTCE